MESKQKQIDWYNPELTIREMAEVSGLRPRNIRAILKRRNAPFKRERTPQKAERYPTGTLPYWYDKDLTAVEMTKMRHGASEASTRIYLSAHKLPYKHRKLIKACDDDMKWYSPNKTLEEMSEESGRTYDGVRMFLNRRNLPFKSRRNY